MEKWLLPLCLRVLQHDCGMCRLHGTSRCHFCATQPLSIFIGTCEFFHFAFSGLTSNIDALTKLQYALSNKGYQTHILCRSSGKTYLPCQVALCQNTLDKVLMTYGGKNMRLNCHSVHVMVDDYYTRHVNIDQPKKWHFWPKEPSAWSLFPAFHTGFGA